jgi:hypothetical protein
MGLTPADKVLSYATKYADENYKEGTNNDTVFGKWIGLNNQPWCMSFVVWCMSAGRALNLVTKTASCEAMEAWAIKNKRTVPPITVQRGDIVLFDFHNEGKSVHTGFALGPIDTKTHLVPTVEGNTAKDGAGSQANGDGVYYKKRKITQIRAVVRPDWSKYEQKA